MLSDQEMRRNQRAVRHALAQQALEGLTVPPAYVYARFGTAQNWLTSEANVETSGVD